MTTKKSAERATQTAEEFMAELQRDPAFLKSQSERRRKQQSHLEDYNRALEPVLQRLANSGMKVDSLRTLRGQRAYSGAIPVLIEMLPELTDLSVKEDIVRTISVPWAGDEAVRCLIAEMNTVVDEGSEGYLWALANGLEVMVTGEFGAELASMVRDERFGKAREMLVLALGKSNFSEVNAVLSELLEDDELVGHAVIALVKRGVRVDSERVEALKKHERAWVRNEAGKLLSKSSPGG